MISIPESSLKAHAFICHVLLLVMIAALAPFQVTAQEVEPIRGMYIDGSDLIIGHEKAEQDLQQFVEDNGITYVVFYIRDTDVVRLGPEISDLINTLKSENGVLQVGATTGPKSQVIVDHNNAYSGKFDVINLELEYWGEKQGTPERLVSFADFTDKLDIMNEIAAGNDLKVEAYIGWVTPEEMAEIVVRLDRLLIHTYVSRPESTYGYGRSRFEMISDLKSDVEVMPIYSLEKTERHIEGAAVFMGQWTLDNSPNKSDYDFLEAFELAESVFDTSHRTNQAATPNFDVNFVGHHYFVFSNIVNIPPDPSMQSPALQHIVVEGSDATPIDFVMSATDVNLQGAEWYQTGSGFIGTARFNNDSTNAMTINSAAPYTLAVIPYDSGLYGRPGLYAKEAITWEVLAQNTLPTAVAALPQNLTIEIEPGTTQTFIHNATDIDGNLFAADWYSSGYLGRSHISGDSATTSREIQFNDVGTFTVMVDLFDRAVYMPANEIRQNKVTRSVEWTVNVREASGPRITPESTDTDTDSGGDEATAGPDSPDGSENPDIPDSPPGPETDENPEANESPERDEGSENNERPAGSASPESTDTEDSFGSNSHAYYDRDRDGVPAWIDDNDYNAEIGDENNAIEPYFDPDGDGSLSFTGNAEQTRDTDGDLVPDSIELFNGTDLNDSLSFIDSDNDGLPDYADSDDDNDGIPDFIEGDADIDGDGIPNRFDTDSDGDGASDASEGAADVDGNSLPNFIDSATVSSTPVNDRDNDGIADEVEGMLDRDSDGLPNYLDIDSDADGILDLDETNADHDADGIANYLDDDSDGDLISDLIEGNADTNDDGIPDFLQSNSSNRTDATGDETASNTRVSSGGCTIGSGKGKIDPMLPLLFIVASFILWRRRLQVQP